MFGQILIVAIVMNSILLIIKSILLMVTKGIKKGKNELITYQL